VWTSIIFPAKQCREATKEKSRRGKSMAIRETVVQRFSIVSHKPFRDVLAALQLELGHPDIAAFTRDMAAANTYAELENLVNQAVGPSGFMEFTRFDIGAVLSKQSGVQAPQVLRIVLGNPLIMSSMARYVPDAASYAPVTILIDERPDGVHLSYDRMASYLAPYGHLEALRVARELDTKVETLLTDVARSDASPLRKTA
jgi:hypothetical protein